MNLLTHARTLAAYNAWVNARIYEACAELPDEARKRDMGAFFKSIHGTLNHLLLADRIWLGRFTGIPFPATSLDQELYGDFAELTSERAREDARLCAWVASLHADDFEKDLSFVSIARPQPRTVPFWIALTHFFNHQAHHRGQVSTLLFQSGVDIGATDLIAFPIPT
jgi:uncharacterized damage-inducible protein DinB